MGNNTNLVKISTAVKVLSGEYAAQLNEEMLEEAKVMASIENTYIVRLLGVTVNDKIMLVLPFMSGGSLNHYVQKHKKKLTPKMLTTWSHQISLGMAYLESRNLVHRDLAARNVLVKSEKFVKITDFGLAKMLESSKDTFKSQGEKIAIKWLAPECFKSKEFSSKSDVWAFGVTLWEMFTFGDRPWKDYLWSDVSKAIESGERLKQPLACSIDLWAVIIMCWTKDPKDRISFSRVSSKLASFAADPDRYVIIEKEGQVVHREDETLLEELEGDVEMQKKDKNDVVLEEEEDIDNYIRPWSTASNIRSPSTVYTNMTTTTRQEVPSLHAKDSYCTTNCGSTVPLLRSARESTIYKGVNLDNLNKFLDLDFQEYCILKIEQQNSCLTTLLFIRSQGYLYQNSSVVTSIDGEYIARDRENSVFEGVSNSTASPNEYYNQS